MTKVKKVFIATPAFDGKVHVQYAIALTETCLLLTNNGYNVQLCINTSGSLLCAERNRILEAFWQSDSDYLLCIDSDLGWPAQSVLDLLKKEEPFVAGVYPARRDNIFMFRPVLNEDGSIVSSEKKLLEMEYIPAGFMLIERSVIDLMRSMYPERYFCPKEASDQLSKGYCLFNTELFDGEFWGEDYIFCKLVRQSGLKIWVDPTIEFDHAGVKGHLLLCLTDKKEVSHPVEKIKGELSH